MKYKVLSNKLSGRLMNISHKPGYISGYKHTGDKSTPIIIGMQNWIERSLFNSFTWDFLFRELRNRFEDLSFKDVDRISASVRSVGNKLIVKNTGDMDAVESIVRSYREMERSMNTFADLEIPLDYFSIRAYQQGLLGYVYKGTVYSYGSVTQFDSFYAVAPFTYVKDREKVIVTGGVDLVSRNIIDCAVAVVYARDRDTAIFFHLPNMNNFKQLFAESLRDLRYLKALDGDISVAIIGGTSDIPDKVNIALDTVKKYDGVFEIRTDDFKCNYILSHIDFPELIKGNIDKRHVFFSTGVVGADSRKGVLKVAEYPKDNKKFHKIVRTFQL